MSPAVALATLTRHGAEVGDLVTGQWGGVCCAQVGAEGVQAGRAGLPSGGHRMSAAGDDAGRGLVDVGHADHRPFWVAVVDEVPPRELVSVTAGRRAWRRDGLCPFIGGRGACSAQVTLRPSGRASVQKLG